MDSSSPCTSPTPSSARKRKRSISPESANTLLTSSASSTLTTSNLARLQRNLGLDTTTLPYLEMSGMAPPSTPTSASGSQGSRKPSTHAAERILLGQHRITIDHPHSALPRVLADHLRDVVNKNLEQTATPSANRIHQARRTPTLVNEATGMANIAKYTLFTGEANGDDGVDLIPKIFRSTDVYLNSRFLPPHRQMKGESRLSSPKPDICIGYVSHELAANAAGGPFECAFSRDHEDILRNFAIASDTFMPWLTAQYKAPSKGLHFEAINQSARDGSVIVNYLHAFYSVADRTSDPCPLKCCHFSVTTNIEIGTIWVHYRVGVEHYMDRVHEFMINGKSNIEIARKILKNIKDYAVVERLDTITLALDRYLANKPADSAFTSPTKRKRALLSVSSSAG